MKSYEENLKKLSDELDKRQDFFNKLEKWYIKYGSVPDKYKIEWTVYLSEGRIPWRQNPKIVKRIQKVARKCSKK